jgi:ParB family transcriptional regulator, chromosome partitioning protein
MDYDIKTVPLSRIDGGDDTFRISAHAPNEALRLSIRSIGLIHPPVVWDRRDRLTVVSGFARLGVCRSLDWHQLPVRCLPPETLFADCALIAVADNASQRTLNVVEMARALDLLARAADDQHGAARLAQSIGLPANAQLAGKLKQVGQMSGRLQQALCGGEITLPMALRLHEMGDAAAAGELISLFQELGWGLNRQREFLDWTQAIAQRDGIGLMDLLTDEPLRQLRRDPRMDRGRKSQLVRRHVKKRRYPAITAFEQQYSQAVKALQVPRGAQLIPPAHFEGQTFGLRLDFRNPGELLDLAREVQQLAGSRALRQLLEAVQPVAP